MPLIRATGLVTLVMLCILGCTLNERTYWSVTDSEIYWNRAGYSVKPPLGNNWVKLPTEDGHPNSIAFQKGEGWIHAGSTVYIKGTVVLATSTLLDEPVRDRKDNNLLASALRDHLNRYQMYWTTKITETVYDPSFGLDCLKYSGTPKIERHRTEKGDISEKEINGYFCLHPAYDNFGVMMESRVFATVWTDKSNNDEQTDHFFKSLRFTPISSSAVRTFKSTNYQVGKAPSQIASYQGKMWVTLKDEDRAVQVDPVNGRTIASVPVGKQPAALAIGENGVWVANSGDGTVSRIDPSNAKIAQTIRIGGTPASVSVGNGYVWVADSSGNAVIRINPATNSVAASIAVGMEPVSVIAGNDGIWTANAGDGTVSLIDKAHDRIIDTVSIGGRPGHISLAKSGAWVTDERGNAAVRINRKSRAVTSRIDVGGKPSWVQAFDGWDIFVALSDSSKIVRIDPKLNRLFGSPILCESSPRSLIYVAGSIWFTNSAGTTLARVDLDPTGQAVGNWTLP